MSNEPNALAAQPQDHLNHLQPIANEDVAGILKAEKTYGSSWKRRGGTGAYMMLCRKFDRLEQQLAKTLVNPAYAQLQLERAVDIPTALVPPYDIFQHAEADVRSEGIIDDIRDLRRYLLLVEAELRARGVRHEVHRDNQVDA